MGVGHFCYLTRRYDQAIAQEVKTLELEPTFFLAHWILALSYEQQGHAEKSRELTQQTGCRSG
jgi:Tfp pilus assembly protein PilF